MKAHLTIRETPLESGEAVEALCGVIVGPVQIVLMWDAIEMNTPLVLSTLLCCSDCAEILAHCEVGAVCAELHYIYAVITRKNQPGYSQDELEMIA